MSTHVERALIDSLETDLRQKQEHVLNLIRERDECAKRLATAEAERDREKERRVHWQGLAYTGMCVVDAVLNNQIRLGEGTTEESMPVNARMAIDKMNHLRREWAAKGGYDAVHNDAQDS